jgi:hypothetical protein
VIGIEHLTSITGFFFLLFFGLKVIDATLIFTFQTDGLAMTDLTPIKPQNSEFYLFSTFPDLLFSSSP